MGFAQWIGKGLKSIGGRFGKHLETLGNSSLGKSITGLGMKHIPNYAGVLGGIQGVLDNKAGADDALFDTMKESAGEGVKRIIEKGISRATEGAYGEGARQLAGTINKVRAPGYGQDLVDRFSSAAKDRAKEAATAAFGNVKRRAEDAGLYDLGDRLSKKIAGAPDRLVNMFNEKSRDVIGSMSELPFIKNNNAI